MCMCVSMFVSRFELSVGSGSSVVCLCVSEICKCACV